jgi:hypothetical protein
VLCNIIRFAAGQACGSGHGEYDGIEYGGLPKRTLDTAVGITVGLRRCGSDAAFQELISAAACHQAPLFAIASDLVALASPDESRRDDSAANLADHREWGGLLARTRIAWASRDAVGQPEGKGPGSGSGRALSAPGCAPLNGARVFNLRPSPALGPPQPQVVADGAADGPRRRDHVEAVEQAEPAQKPFGQNGIRTHQSTGMLAREVDRIAATRIECRPRGARSPHRQDCWASGYRPLRAMV